MPERHPHLDFVRAFSTRRYSGVFIDDTGSPGSHQLPLGPHPERKTWVSVIVPPDRASDMLQFLAESLEMLERLWGAKEFHFAEIYAGKEPFKKSDLSERLALFEFMVEAFRIFDLPVFVQTFDPITLAKFRAKGPLPDKAGPFDSRKIGDMALLVLLMRVKFFIEKHRKSLKSALVFVDEGWKREGVCFPLPWEKEFAGGLVCFARSTTVPPIQLADFAAFCLNRSQLLYGKEKLGDLDVAFLHLVAPLTAHFQNIPKLVGTLGEWEKIRREGKRLRDL